MALNRRRFLQTAGVAAAGAVAVGADATFVAPIHPVLNRMEIPLLRLPPAFDGFTIVQLSDFHFDETFSVVPLRHAVEMVSKMKPGPDLIVFTGDYVTEPLLHRFLHNRKQAANAAEPCGAWLRQLHAEFGSHAILGNHDYNTDAHRVAECLRGQGIPVLINQSVAIERGGRRLWLAGIDDNPDDGDINLALKGIPPDEAVIALVHEPDAADVVSHFPVDLQLSGHSHGGQVRLPLVGPAYLPPLGKKYPWGLRKVGGLTLYTNVGLGTMGAPVRLNCPPEITEFTLRVSRLKPASE
jgi:predicted MPP superfamily phosphohydrolase